MLNFHKDFSDSVSRENSDNRNSRQFARRRSAKRIAGGFDVSHGMIMSTGVDSLLLNVVTFGHVRSTW